MRVHKRLGWLETARDREDVEDLIELLEAKAAEDAEGGGREGGTVRSSAEAGVWVFE